MSVKQGFVLRDTIIDSTLSGTEYTDGDMMITDGEGGKIYFTKEQLEALEGFLALRKHK